MQEQQQQQLKAMLGPRGQLAYYGLRVPPQQQVTNTAGLTRGLSQPFRTMVAPSSNLHSVRPSLGITAYGNATSSSPSLTTTSASATTVTGIVNLRPSTTSTFSVNNTLSTLTNNPAITTNTIAKSTLVTANTSASSVLNPGSIATISSSENSLCSNPSITDSMVNSISSSTSQGSDTGKMECKLMRGLENGSGGRRTPPPPSRMVTRSQTAAVRAPVSMEVDDRQQNSRGKTYRRARSYGDKDDRDGCSSPRKLREGGMSGGIGFDDFPFTKNPAGAGIEFGAVCTDCGAVAVTGAGWNAHQAAHRGDGAPCSHCAQVFLTTHGRDIHQQLHRDGHSRDVDDYCECGLCGGSFISVIYLELHLLELHGRDALYDQQALHLGPTSNESSCPQEDESGRQLFRCGVCQTQFTYSLNLDCHMALHTDASYACALCDAAFSSLDPLVNHSRAHRFAGIPPTTVAGMPVHLPGVQVPLRQHTPTQRSLHPTTPTPFNMWGLQQARANQHPVVTPPTCPTTPIGVPMSPAMLNYCMMMSLWGGDKANTNVDSSVWPSYLNPAMNNVFNYINPYLLNNNNNNNTNNNNNNMKCKNGGGKSEQDTDEESDKEESNMEEKV